MGVHSRGSGATRAEEEEVEEVGGGEGGDETLPACKYK